MSKNLKSTDQIPIGQVAERSGIPISAIHFYEREGMISSTRSSGNHRQFSRDVLRRLAFIRASQRVGIPLMNIKEALDELPLKRTPKESDWGKVGKQWHKILSAQIEYMERVRDDLRTCIGCGCLSFQRCQLVNQDDALASEGAGPRRLLPGTPRPDRS
ncbi:MAG: redox-sensitive transcriptional activator SoxR [Actinobacteria bacterium]|nr:redox-sensitive transcriptional activator SoxR [Actinomycetota bacterium]